MPDEQEEEVEPIKKRGEEESVVFWNWYSLVYGAGHGRLDLIQKAMKTPILLLLTNTLFEKRNKKTAEFYVYSRFGNKG